VVRRRQALDRRIESDHGASHGLAGGVSIEATEDRTTLMQKNWQPVGIGPSAGGGDATVEWMEGKAANGVDS
jgi:hypothetical protein